MRHSWFRRGADDARAWWLVADGVALATLQRPRPESTQRLSLEIVPVTLPADPRLADEQFWRDGGWQLVELSTGAPATPVHAGPSALRRHQNRVVLQGLAVLAPG